MLGRIDLYSKGASTVGERVLGGISKVPKGYHLEKTPMQYKAIFQLKKKIENFIGKFFDIFNIHAQDIDCGYISEPLR